MQNSFKLLFHYTLEAFVCVDLYRAPNPNHNSSRLSSEHRCVVVNSQLSFIFSWVLSFHPFNPTYINFKTLSFIELPTIGNCYTHTLTVNSEIYLSWTEFSDKSKSPWRDILQAWAYYLSSKFLWLRKMVRRHAIKNFFFTLCSIFSLIFFSKLYQISIIQGDIMKYSIIYFYPI